MNLAECVKRVQQIQAASGDDENAHSMEDALYADFVKHVSEVGKKSLRDMAREILKTESIKFGRWCA